MPLYRKRKRAHNVMVRTVQLAQRLNVVSDLRNIVLQCALARSQTEKI